MKHLKILCFICILAALCFLSGCQKEEARQQASCPVDEETILSALKKTGLQGKISESETESYKDGHILYVVRSETETYDDPDNGVLVAGVSCAETEDGRMVSGTFDRLNTEQFSWEDWKQQIAFAALVYGGFDNEDAVYKAFCEKELPDSSPFVWEEELLGVRCSITYQPRSHTRYDDDGNAVDKYAAILRVDIYEQPSANK